MINLRNVPIGSLLKVVFDSSMAIFSESEPNKIERLWNLTDKIILLLDYKEGVFVVENVNSILNRKSKVYFMVRILVMCENKKFWLASAVSENVNIIDLPDDLKNQYRETNKFEIVNTEDNPNNNETF